MAWTPYQTFLALLMVVTGSINTISTKWGDNTQSAGKDGVVKDFRHPFVQATGMFLGETFCLLAFFITITYYRKYQRLSDEELPETVKSQKYNRFIFLLPAMCDMTATSTMYAGLTMTSASSAQMLRGALIVFTGLFSIVFLKRKLRSFHWIGIFFIIIGLVVVGLQDLLTPKEEDQSDLNQMLLGNALTVLAQILTATQMILEEKFLSGKQIAPLEAVGLEGLFGLIVLSSLLYPLSFIKVYQKNAWVPIEDPVDAFYQIKNSWKIMLAVIGNICSIAFFNFAGVSVTKEMSATTRTVLDSIRTLTVWAASLAFDWEKMNYLQPIGFVSLVIGMFVYNDVLIRPWLIRKGFIEPVDDIEQQLIEGAEANGPTMS